ncbi:MAG: hypothetical protein KGS61_13960 [Verrucomicrobia bacterium]|nr:hypothetical protein [Verrucomicrobiota bacterium]
MNYVTLEVEIDHGRVVAKEPAQLPEKATGLLTILQPITPATARRTPLQALETLQSQLRLDEKKAAEWMADVREARR